jgi:transcriptional regulator with XRE-family HTH domain
MTKTLDGAVRHAIEQAPGSIRALAREAGVSNVMLQGITSGRERATARVALEVAKVLDRWAKLCGTEAASVRAAVKGHNRKEGTA